MRRLIPLCCLFFAVAVGGCGSGASSGGSDPAKLVPADAAMYVEGVVRPDGDQGDAARSLASKLLQTGDPGKKIRSLIDDGLRKESPGTTFDKDIDPWLGDRIGVALSDFQRDEPRYTIVIAS